MAARLWTEPAGSGQVEGPYCAVQHDDGSGSPSLGVVTCASHRSVLVGWGIVRVVTTGSRRGSDDAIGAGVLPLSADSVAAGIALAGAIAIGRREGVLVFVTRGTPGADVFGRTQLLLLGAGERGCSPHECRRNPIATAPRLPWIAAERWLALVARMLSKRLTTGLQVSPSLAAAGVEEISPALALDLASIGRCVYGHQPG